MSSGRFVLAVIWSIIAGVGVALQARINGELGLRLHDGSLAALISFSSGLAILSLLLVFSPKGRAGLHTVGSSIRRGEMPWWTVLGGIGGGVLVLSQGLVAGMLGVALFSVAVIAGQTLGALWIDTRGVFGLSRIALSLPRVGGALLVVLGVMTSVGIFTPTNEFSWAFFFPLIAGAGTGFQQAINGRVRAASNSALSATFINFAAGTALLAVATAIISPLTGGPEQFPTDWWLYTGGLVGTIFIAIQTVTVNQIGVLGLGVSLVTGQILGSIGLDVFAPVGDHPVTTVTVVGALITVAGSVAVTLTRKNQGR